MRLKVLHAAIAILLAATALCAAWRPLLLKGLVPMDGNMIALSYPHWAMARSIPLMPPPSWNPYRNLGEPYLADPQTMALYPPMRLLSAFASFQGFMAIWVVFHSLLAAAFLGALAWRRHADLPAAAAAAALAAFNGFFASRVTFLNHFASAAWLPAALYFQHLKSPLGVGFCLALQWLSGFPPFSLLTALAVAGAAWHQGRTGIRCAAKGGALALGLAAVQWIPFAELFAQSVRSLTLDPRAATEYSLPLGQLAKELLLPLWSWWRPEVDGDPAIAGFYVGLVALALAVFAACRGGRGDKRLAAASLAALILSLGGHLPGYAAFAAFRVFRFPANWLLLSCAGLSLLAASGVARLRSAWMRALAASLLAAELLAFAQAGRVAWARPGFLSDAPALTRGFQEARRWDRIYHEDALMRAWERGKLETEEDYSLMRDLLAPSFGAAFGICEARSYQTLRHELADMFQKRLSASGDSFLMDFAGIRLVVGLEAGASRVSSGSVRLRTRMTAKPRAFIVEPGAGEASITGYAPGRAEIRVRAQRACTLVLAETHVPGWKAALDDRPAQPGSFGIFMSIDVPPGDHAVRFAYAPASISAGAAISLLTLAAALLVI
ncbi:MAG: hypothetical protein HY922_14050 [Elusimicrobia bacterium]|nr:hypothetical protein [Elusimicrobiota bacterium]